MDNYSRVIDSSYFRELGWAQLTDKWIDAVVLTLLYCVIYTAFSTVLSQIGVGLIATFLIAPMYYSYNVAFLENKRSGAALNVEKLIVGYNDFTRIAVTMLLVYVYTFLWTLLFIIPGIIKTISYSQVPFILKDNPNLKYNQAIELSMEMMEGHKMQYFILVLSFIGWFLLVIVTFGIATLWVTPYFTATLAHYYEYVKEEYERKVLTF